MNLNLIAAGLRQIANGLEDPTPAGSLTAPVYTEPKPAAAPAATQPAPAAQPVAGLYGAPATAPAQQSQAIGRNDLIDVFKQLHQKLGEDAVIGLLRNHGVMRISEIADPRVMAEVHANALALVNSQ